MIKQKDIDFEASNHPKKRNDIQALRAIAVIAVVVCHMSPSWLPGGYLGVDIFFVISGFVITQLLLKHQENIQFYDFWARRISRILPAYIVMLTLVSFATALLFLPENFDQFNQSWRKSLAFVSNQYFAKYGDYFSPALVEQPLLHTWSLAIEMQFYLIYPLLVWFMLKLKAPWLLIMLTAIGFIVGQLTWELSVNNSANYYALFIRAPEFLLGGALAAYSRTLSARWCLRYGPMMALLGYLILIYSLVMFSAELFSPITALVTCLGCALVILAEVKAGIFVAINQQRTLLFIGAISYSIYLWHWPILALSRYVYGDIQWSFINVVLYLAIVLIFSAISWKFVEIKFQLLNVGSMLEKIKKLIVIFLVAISPTVFAKKVNRFVPSLSVEYMRYADDATICHGKVLESCTKGSAIDHEVLIIGDSHAAQLNLAAEVASKSLDIGFEVLTASSCIPLPGFDLMKLEAWARKACENQIEVVSQKILSANKIILAGMWTYQLQDPKFIKVLNDFLKGAELRQQQVWVFAQIPKLTNNPMRQVRFQHLGITTPALVGLDWKVANDKIFNEVKSYSNIYWFDPSSYPLFATPPFFEMKLIYHDDHHLNEVGAKQYGDLLIGLLQPVIGKK